MNIYREVRILWNVAGGAFQVFSRNPRRVVLASVGIAIGISSLTLISLTSRSIHRYFNDSISIFGTEYIYLDGEVDSKQQDESGTPNVEYTLSQYLRDHASLVEHVSAKLRGLHRVESQSIHQREPSIVPAANISAVEPAYSKIRNLSIGKGAFFSLSSSKSTHNVCVLGHSIANKLFDGHAVGNAIYIEDHEFFVAGVLEERGGEVFGLTTDQEIYVPLQTYVSLFGGRDQEATIYLELVGKALLSEGKDQVRSLARVKRGVPPGEKDEFTIHERSEVKERVESVRSVIRRGGYLVAFLNFLAGGICVTSIMYIFTKRQTREIGVRMSCGAKRRHIAFSFLLESTLICLVGGMAGLIISCGAFFTAAHLSFLHLYVPVYEISLSFFVFTTGGIVFGLLPAISASRVSPIVSIRHE